MKKFSDMIMKFATGGNLVPITNNVQMVQGDTHQQDTNKDGMTGVMLNDKQGNPYAEVENEEAIIDGNKVVSNSITDKEGQSLAKKVQQLAMIKETLSQESEMLKMAKAEYDDLKNKSGSRYDTGEINRELEDLEPRIIMLQESINDIDSQIQSVFQQQEIMKQQSGITEQNMQSENSTNDGPIPVQGENLNESSGIPQFVDGGFLDKKYYPNNPYDVNAPYYINNDLPVTDIVNQNSSFTPTYSTNQIPSSINRDITKVYPREKSISQFGEQPTFKRNTTENKIQTGIDIAAHALPFIDAIAANRAVNKTPKYKQPIMSKTPQINTDYDISAQTASLNNSRDLALQNIDNTVNNSQVAAAMKMKIINDYNTQVNNLQSQKINAENQLRNQQTLLGSQTAKENNQLLMSSQDRDTQRQAGMLLDKRKIGTNITDKLLSMYDNERMRRFQERQLDLESQRYKDSGVNLNTLNIQELEKTLNNMNPNDPMYKYIMEELSKRNGK